ncbi:MAG: transposase [Meiothermus sp.]|nr:transposase [Meiothermus sp.]
MNSLAQLPLSAGSEVKWVVGVDAHKRSFSYVLLGTGLGGLGGGVKTQGELPNTQAGYAQLLSGLKEHGCGLGTGSELESESESGSESDLESESESGSGLVFAVENARGYGLGLSWYLLSQGQQVYDIPATEIAHMRKRRQKVKNDFEDARQAATVLLEASVWEKRFPLRLPTSALQIQSLERSRESLVAQRVAIGQQIEALAAQPYALPQVRTSLEAVYTTLQQQIRELEKVLEKLLEPYRALLNATGIGLVSAAVLIGEAQDMRRFRSEAAFASYAGVAPKPPRITPRPTISESRLIQEATDASTGPLNSSPGIASSVTPTPEPTATASDRPGWPPDRPRGPPNAKSVVRSTALCAKY